MKKEDEEEIKCIKWFFFWTDEIGRITTPFHHRNF